MKKGLLIFIMIALGVASAFYAWATSPPPSRCQVAGKIIRIDKGIHHPTTGVRSSDKHPEGDVYCDPRPYYMLTLAVSVATDGQGCPPLAGETMKMRYPANLDNAVYERKLALAKDEINQHLREDPSTRRIYERELNGNKVMQTYWTEAAREKANAFCEERGKNIVESLWDAPLGFAVGDTVEIDYDFSYWAGDDVYTADDGVKTLGLKYISTIQRKTHNPRTGFSDDPQM